REQVLAVDQHLAVRVLVVLAAGEHIAQGGLVRDVAAHHGMHLTGRDDEVHALEDFAVLDASVQVADFKDGGGHVFSPDTKASPLWRQPQIALRAGYPTLPSRLIEISFCVSTMNSIGRCCSTSRTKPLTISATASSSERPRCMQ